MKQNNINTCTHVSSLKIHLYTLSGFRWLQINKWPPVSVIQGHAPLWRLCCSHLLTCPRALKGFHVQLSMSNICKNTFSQQTWKWTAEHLKTHKSPQGDCWNVHREASTSNDLVKFWAGRMCVSHIMAGARQAERCVHGGWWGVKLNECDWAAHGDGASNERALLIANIPKAATWWSAAVTEQASC